MKTTAGSAKIVCATDFSSNAGDALRWAATTAAAPGDSLDLVTVISPPATAVIDLMMDSSVLDAARVRVATERLEQLAGTAERDFGIKVTPYVVTGQPAQAIAEHAESVKARLIVLGARARLPLDRRILGQRGRANGPDSQPAGCCRSPQGRNWPLWRNAPDPGGHRGWSCGRSGPRARRGFAPDPSVRRHVPAPLLADRRVSAPRAARVAGPVRRLIPTSSATSSRILRRRIGDLPGKGAVELSIRPAWGEPAANLLSVADEGDFGLLIVGAERRHGFARFWHPSVSQRAIRHAAGAVVICVPPPAIPQPKSIAVAPPRISSVLAPTDLSASGNAATTHAYALLSGHGGVVELCHVHERSLPNPPYAYERPRDRLSADVVAELERQLRALVPPYAEQLGITTHVSIIDGGAPAEAIVQASERLAVDAIIVGSRGRGSVASTLMGSVAHKVVSQPQAGPGGSASATAPLKPRL